MPKIEEGLKLDFHNVLIRPKRSTIDSRSNVDLSRTFQFKRCKASWKGVPVIASNMDTIGCFDVYEVLSKHRIITAFHKFYDVQDFVAYQDDNGIAFDPELFMVSTGIKDADFDRLKRILERVPCNWICIDIANGYIKALVDFCKRVRAEFPIKSLLLEM